MTTTMATTKKKTARKKAPTAAQKLEARVAELEGARLELAKNTLRLAEKLEKMMPPGELTDRLLTIESQLKEMGARLLRGRKVRARHYDNVLPRLEALENRIYKMETDWSTPPDPTERSYTLGELKAVLGLMFPRQYAGSPEPGGAS